MITIQGIDHMNLGVLDLQRSIEFYRRVFGFRLLEDGRDRTDAPWVIVGIPGQACLALHQNGKSAPSEEPRINHWGFAIGDLETALATLRDNGVKILYADRPSEGVFEWPKSKSLYISDPDGHCIELATVFGGGLKDTDVGEGDGA